MVAFWVEDEMATVDLQDRRLNERVRQVLSQLAARPAASVAAACGGHTDMTAAYRLFDNPKATFDSILQPHQETTRRRIADQSVALLVHDTTEMDLTRPFQQVVGAGPLDGGSRRGMFLHAVHAFTPDGTPLGTLAAQTWSRDEASRSRSERAAAPIEEKESHRWLETFERAEAEAAHCTSTQLINVADSEADIYEVLASASTSSADWIIRACQNRKLQDGQRNESAECVLDRVAAQPSLFTEQIEVRGREAKVSCETRARRQSRERRSSKVQVRAVPVTLRPPTRGDRELPPVTANAVLIDEIDPPSNEPPVRWLLLTSLPIDSTEQVREVIDYYRARWTIELLFRTLKSGCRIEERRFESLDRVLPCLALYLIVAWRTLYVCRLGCRSPALSCEAVFDPAEWRAVWQVIHRTPPPRAAPSLDAMVRLIAQLGGYINHESRDPPGPQTLWLGLQRMHDFTLAWKLFQTRGAAGVEDV